MDWAGEIAKHFQPGTFVAEVDRPECEHAVVVDAVELLDLLNEHQRILTELATLRVAQRFGSDG